MATCIISPTGTITLPADILDELGVLEGEDIILELHSDHIEMRAGPQAYERMHQNYLKSDFNSIPNKWQKIDKNAAPQSINDTDEKDITAKLDE